MVNFHFKTATSAGSVEPITKAAPAGKEQVYSNVPGVAPGAAEQYQQYILPMVSRTFGLTIPQLPGSLRRVIANAYLLARAADTLEDEKTLDKDRKYYYGEALMEIVAGRGDVDRFAGELALLLSPGTSQAERNLIRNLPLIIHITRTFTTSQQQAIERCIRIMWKGMHCFLDKRSRYGLATRQEMEDYCYYVAGVVGEMLTALFSEYCPAIAAKQEEMRKLSVSFGHALQIVNILKDQWEDRQAGTCWLPRDLFALHGVRLEQLEPGNTTEGYRAALLELVGMAHAHLRNAFRYTLLIPASEPGIRRFCYWAIALAALTLRNITRRPDFTAAAAIKVRRRKVAQLIALTRFTGVSNWVLKQHFRLITTNLPLRETALSAI